MMYEPRIRYTVKSFLFIFVFFHFLTIELMNKSKQ